MGVMDLKYANRYIGDVQEHFTWPQDVFQERHLSLPSPLSFMSTPCVDRCLGYSEASQMTLDVSI